MTKTPPEKGHLVRILRPTLEEYFEDTMPETPSLDALTDRIKRQGLLDSFSLGAYATCVKSSLEFLRQGNPTMAQIYLESALSVIEKRRVELNLESTP